MGIIPRTAEFDEEIENFDNSSVHSAGLPRLCSALEILRSPVSSP